jgi:hypothetical protein
LRTNVNWLDAGRMGAAGYCEKVFFLIIVKINGVYSPTQLNNNLLASIPLFQASLLI